ncbi:hypothetical protein [Herbidospora sp. NBRC 101105]|uniref:DUF7158 domain-containing protein n=1 Tax=Herbidospora sp. NBRC 101105 TaxID=3032195 RepID=UPI0024A3BD9D|nr:hypothetical protein [Herbidospora sp. NBRC 101105]GLX99270.1 malonyl CoA-ACP transacylase [Herbidospora sp. NBRC 101105]
MIAALVEGAPVTLEQVAGRMAALRRGPRGDLLPADGTTEGRQLRRWVVQLLVAERVVAAEAARRGLRPWAGPPMELSATARLELGSVMAAVLSGDRLAQAVYRELTAGVTVSEEDVRRYYAANPDRYRPGPARAVTHWRNGVAAEYEVTRAELVPEAVFRAAEGDHVTHGEEVFVVGAYTKRDLSLAEAAPRIRGALLDAARRRRFVLWADARCAAAVLTPGYEHPGDINHPDHTHRH